MGCKTFAFIFLFFLFGLLLARAVFSCANGEWIVGYTIVRVDDAAVVYEAGFLLGNELILGGELVTEGLNDVVLGS